MNNKAAEWLIIIGAVTLIYAAPITEDKTLTLETLRYRSDFAFLGAILLASIGTATRFILTGASRNRTYPVVVSWVLMCFLGFVFLATSLSLIRYGLDIGLFGASNLSKLLIGTFLLLITAIYAKRSKVFADRLVIALAAPPAFLVVVGTMLLLSPSTLVDVCTTLLGTDQRTCQLIEIGARFQGLQMHPWQVAITCTVAFSIVWVAAIQRATQKEWVFASVLLLYAASLLITILLSLTRVALLSIGIAVVLGAMVARSAKPNFRGLVVSGFVLLLFGVFAITALDVAEFGEQLWERLGEGEDRTAIWSFFAQAALDNPLGVGLSFEDKYVLITRYQELWNPHNSFLSAWMLGGVGGLTCFILFLVSLWKKAAAGLAYVQSANLKSAYPGIVTACATFFPFTIVGGVMWNDFYVALISGLVLAGPRGSAPVDGTRSP